MTENQCSQIEDVVVPNFSSAPILAKHRVVILDSLDKFLREIKALLPDHPHRCPRLSPSQEGESAQSWEELGCPYTWVPQETSIVETPDGHNVYVALKDQSYGLVALIGILVYKDGGWYSETYTGQKAVYTQGAILLDMDAYNLPKYLWT